MSKYIQQATQGLLVELRPKRKVAANYRPTGR